MRHCRASSFAEDNAAAVGVVGGDFHDDAIARDDTDEIFAHFSGDVREDGVATFDRHAKLSVGQGLDDLAFHFNRFFFGHAETNSWPAGAAEMASIDRMMTIHHGSNEDYIATGAAAKSIPGHLYCGERRIVRNRFDAAEVVT